MMLEQMGMNPHTYNPSRAAQLLDDYDEGEEVQGETDRIYEPVDVEGAEGQYYVDPQGYLMGSDGEYVRDDTGHIVNENNQYSVDNSGNWILTGGEGVTLGPLGEQLLGTVEAP